LIRPDGVLIASVTRQDIPVIGPPREVLRETLVINRRTLKYSAATIGNPYGVILRDRVSAAEAREFSPLSRPSCVFYCTNMQLLQVIARQNIRMAIWKRGVRYTLAFRSDSWAAAAVAHWLGLCDTSVMVHMPEGQLLRFSDRRMVV
jgi:diaminopimelate epimerase